MKTEFIPKVVTLFAGAVVCIVSIIKNVDTTRALEILLATLIAFYIVGIIARKIIERVIESNSVIKKEAEELVNVDKNNNDSEADQSEKENKEE